MINELIVCPNNVLHCSKLTVVNLWYFERVFCLLTASSKANPWQSRESSGSSGSGNGGGKSALLLGANPENIEPRGATV